MCIILCTVAAATIPNSARISLVYTIFFFFFLYLNNDISLVDCFDSDSSHVPKNELEKIKERKKKAKNKQYRPKLRN